MNEKKSKEEINNYIYDLVYSAWVKSLDDDAKVGLDVTIKNVGNPAKAFETFWRDVNRALFKNETGAYRTDADFVALLKKAKTK